jgi:hypothetical protein
MIAFRRIKLYGLLLLCAVCALAPTWSAPTSTPDRILRIHLPENIDPGKLTMLRGGYFLSPVPTQTGVYDYTIDLKYTSYLKLLLFCPGFKVVTAAFDANKVSSSQPFEPKFDASPIIPVRLKFTYSDGKPVANTPVELHLSLSWPPRGPFTGILGFTMGREAELATGFTDSNGGFAADVPSLPDDPYFATPGSVKGFSIKLKLPYRYGRDFIPAEIAARTSYPETVGIEVVYHGRIRGRLSQAFLSRNNIILPPVESGNNVRPAVSRVWVAANKEKQANEVSVGNDGRFTMSLAPDTYDLAVWAQDGKRRTDTRSLPVRSGIVLKEDQDNEIEIE